MEHIARQDFTAAHRRAECVVPGQHRSTIAGLGAQERNERLKKAFAADQKDQLLAIDFVHLVGRTVLKRTPVTRLRDIFSAYTVKDLKHMMGITGVFGDVDDLRGLRKSDLVALVVGMFSSAAKDVPGLLASMMPNELEAFRRLFESGGRADISLSQQVSLNDMPLPAPPLVIGFLHGKTLTLLIPQEFRDPLANVDWEQLLQKAKGLEEAMRIVDAVSDFYGVASYDVAYRAYKDYVADPVPKQVLYDALCTGVYGKASGCVPMSLDGQRFLVRNSLAWYENDKADDIRFGEQQLDEILEFREAYPPKPVPKELLAAGSVDRWLAQLDIAQELLAFFEAHLADGDLHVHGEDECVVIDFMYRQLVAAAMQHDGVAGLFYVLSDFGYDVPDEQMDYLLGLYLVFETKVPKWHNHAWTIIDVCEGAYNHETRPRDAEVLAFAPKGEAATQAAQKTGDSGDVLEFAPRTSTSVSSEPEPEQATSLEKKSCDSADSEYEAYELRCAELEKLNEGYLEEFDEWLAATGLKDKTIAGHVDNVAFFLNHFLQYYDALPMEEGPAHIDEFLGDWFIRKAMWSSAATYARRRRA